VQMTSPTRNVPDSTILTTGIIAWLLLAFASIKLSVIYASNPKLAYLLAYNISSFVFLVYFIGYFKERFGIKYLLLLVLTYNVGINLLHFIYDELFLLEPPPAEYARVFLSCLINVPVMATTWLLLYWFIRRKR
jgi:hypothetical protein